VLPETFNMDIFIDQLGATTLYYKDFVDYYERMQIPFEYMNSTNYLYNRGLLFGDDTFYSNTNKEKVK
jgi:hypothetical protein